MLLAKIDEFGKAGWIMLVVLGFWLAWPLGLMTVAFLAGSGRLRMMRRASRRGSWSNMARDDEQTGSPWGNWAGAWSRPRTPASGNKAFDDYRDDTMRRLEDEEREFQAFLERLRKARDKSEFDAFMAERRNRAAPVQDVSENV